MRMLIIPCILLVAIAQTVQGRAFTNLDFESASLSAYSMGLVPAADAIPGWTAYAGGIPLTNINYSGLPTGNVGIIRTSSSLGDYYVFLQGSGYINTRGSIGQTGTIPLTAQSLTFWGRYANLDETLSFKGQNLPLSVVGLTDNYVIYGANISAYAGQTGQLLFTSGLGYEPNAAAVRIDNIQFSSFPIPEPGGFILFSLGGLVLFWHRRPGGSI